MWITVMFIPHEAGGRGGRRCYLIDFISLGAHLNPGRTVQMT